MAWINVRDQLPEDGQEVYYFSPILGLWRGKYVYRPFTHATWYDKNNQPHTEPVSEGLRNAVSPHVFIGGGGCCDTDEVTHWQPYDADREAAGWVPLPPNHGISDERMDEYREWRDTVTTFVPEKFREAIREAQSDDYVMSEAEAAALSEDAPKNRPTVEPKALPSRPEASWMDADELMVDPPSGWRYGFPKVWNRKTHPDMTAWLIENGYPEKAAKNKNLPYRFTSVPKEEAV